MFNMAPECLDTSRCGKQLGQDAGLREGIRDLVKDVETKFGQDGGRIISEQKAAILNAVAAYNPATESWLTAKRQSLELDGEPYIGVHIRHGDKGEEGVQPVDTGKYVDQIKGVLDVQG